MNAHATSPGDLLINGALHRELWQHPSAPCRPIVCPVTRQTFGADRWKVRFAAPEGGPVTQVRSEQIPPGTPVDCSVELRPVAEVTQTVFFGQRIEAAEAVRYRRLLALSAWLFIDGSGDAEITLHLNAPRERDVFGGPFGECLDLQAVEKASVPRGRWALLELSVDARAFKSTGLSLELAIPPDVFSGPVRIAHLRLSGSGDPAPAPRPPAVEAWLAGRFFQRHDSARLNSLGRALVVNAHELHFQFTFPEMRAFPNCTLPHTEEGLRVFSLDGIPQQGFQLDVTYRSRSSVMIRATRERHGLADGYLSFVGTSAAILLSAEL